MPPSDTRVLLLLPLNYDIAIAFHHLHFLPVGFQLDNRYLHHSSVYGDRRRCIRQAVFKPVILNIHFNPSLI